MTYTETTGTLLAPDPAELKGGTTIHNWHPENDEFWENGGGKQVARRNLIWSILAEHLGFSVWLFWSVSAAMLAKVGFAFTPSQLFVLVAVPNAVGSLLRLPYTFAVPKFGGRNWTVVSALLLLIPTLLFAVAVQNPDTPYWAFLLISATAGFGGGNFASSMANINHFYPAKAKGLALGLNAAGGNIGVAVLQLGLPILVGAGGLFGLVKASEGGVHLGRAGYLYAVLAVAAAVLAYFLMNNIAGAKSSVAETASVMKFKHTWIMSFLYIGTFGSFIGYSAAMPLLIKINFFRQPVPIAEPLGINFAYYAFLGALVGSFTRPFGGWLADKYGGAKITLYAFVAMIVGTLGIYWTLTTLKTVPTPPKAVLAGWQADPSTFPGYKPAVVDAVTSNTHVFPWFLLAFLFVFAATGIGNGSTFKMIPAIWKTQVDTDVADRASALRAVAVQSSAAIGIISAVGAFGGFLIPMTFGAPWVADPVSAVKAAFIAFTVFYVVCAAVTWSVYQRKGSTMAKAGV